MVLLPVPLPEVRLLFGAALVLLPLELLPELRLLPGAEVVPLELPEPDVPGDTYPGPTGAV